MRLLVFGGWFGSRNLGDDAILVGLREVLEANVPGVRITALSTDPEYTRKACGVDTIRLQSPRGLLRNREEYLMAFRDADAVIVTGGTPIYDYGHVSRAIHMGLPVAKGRPMILFGVGAKPLRSTQGREIIKLLLMGAAAVSVRDHFSWRALAQLSTKPISVTGDTGILVRTEATGTALEKPAVVVCPRLLSTNYRAHYHAQLTQENINKTRLMVAYAVDALRDRGLNIYIVPFHTVRPDDDRLEITSIMNLAKHRDVEVLERPRSPGEALNLLSQADLVLGLRLHSLVLAAAAGTPVASIDYDPKIRGFMEMVGAEEYMCHTMNSLRSLTVAAMTALERREETRETLMASTEAMRRRIIGEAVRIRGLLRGF